MMTQMRSLLHLMGAQIYADSEMIVPHSTLAPERFAKICQSSQNMDTDFNDFLN
jgi:hypothetical protein